MARAIPVTEPGVRLAKDNAIVVPFGELAARAGNELAPATASTAAMQRTADRHRVARDAIFITTSGCVHFRNLYCTLYVITVKGDSRG
jgi:hypothetical protein